MLRYKEEEFTLKSVEYLTLLGNVVDRTGNTTSAIQHRKAVACGKFFKCLPQIQAPLLSLHDKLEGVPPNPGGGLPVWSKVLAPDGRQAPEGPNMGEPDAPTPVQDEAATGRAV